MIEITQQLLTDDIKKQVYEGFQRHAISTIGYDEKYEPIAFVAMEGASFAGTVVAELFWGALHVKYAYITDRYRDQGLGNNLMEHAFSYGRKNKCSFAFVETMSFQALEFYQKLGFQLEFTRSGYVHGTKLHYLQKKL